MSYSLLGSTRKSSFNEWQMSKLPCSPRSPKKVSLLLSDNINPECGITFLTQSEPIHIAVQQKTEKIIWKTHAG